MLKIRASECFEIVFFVERMFQALASSSPILTPTYRVESRFKKYSRKYGCGSWDEQTLKSFCFTICESRDPVIQIRDFSIRVSIPLCYAEPMPESSFPHLKQMTHPHHRPQIERVFACWRVHGRYSRSVFPC